MLLATRAFAKDESKPNSAPSGGEGGLGDLIDRFRQGGLEDVVKSWIGTGPNKAISPPQLQRALGPKTIDNLSQESGLPKDDLLSQLSKLLPEIIDKLTPNGKLPPDRDLLPGPDEGSAQSFNRLSGSYFGPSDTVISTAYPPAVQYRPTGPRH